MSGEWRLSLEKGNATNCYVRSISWDEFNTFKTTGELPEVGSLPSREPKPFGFYRGFIPRRRIFAHHERHWPGTSPGLNRFGFPTKRTFPRRRLRLVVSK